MNQQRINNCPVCGMTLDNGLCPKCGYLRLLFPSVIPEPLKKQESARLSIAKRTIKEIEMLKEQNENVQQHSKKTIDDLKDAIKTHEEASQQAKSAIQEMGIKISGLLSNKNTLESQLKDSKSKQSEFASRVKEMAKIISSNNLEMDRLKRDLEELTQSPTRTNTFLILLYDGEYSVLPVGNERRYYATGPGMELCPVPESQIIMLPVMTTIRTAFSIEKSDTAFRLTDFSGNLRSTGLVRGNKLRLTQGVTIQVEGSNMRLYFCIN